MAEKNLDGYRYTDKWGAEQEVDVIKAKRFIFWYRLIWRVIWGAAVVVTLINIPQTILVVILCIAGAAGLMGAIIWGMEKADKNNRILKNAKKIGVRKDV